jgi:predicted DCC family thiol-disulfide oxidoreductase YuxK
MGHARTAGWVLYDAQCGLCSWAAGRHAARLKDLGYRLKPLQEAGDKLPGLADPQEMMVLTLDDQIFSGVDAYLHLLARLPHTTKLVKILRHPRINQFARLIYRWIAKHRSHISHACRLRPKEKGINNPA